MRAENTEICDVELSATVSLLLSAVLADMCSLLNSQIDDISNEFKKRIDAKNSRGRLRHL